MERITADTETCGILVQWCTSDTDSESESEDWRECRCHYLLIVEHKFSLTFINTDVGCKTCSLTALTAPFPPLVCLPLFGSLVIQMFNVIAFNIVFV